MMKAENDTHPIARKSGKRASTLTPRQAENEKRFIDLFERVHGGGLRAIDYSRVRVDGGRRDRGGDSDAYRATEMLHRIEDGLGTQGYIVLSGIAGEGRTIGDVARSIISRTNSASTKMVHSYVALRYQEALDQLDSIWRVNSGKLH